MKAALFACLASALLVSAERYVVVPNLSAADVVANAQRLPFYGSYGSLSVFADSPAARALPGATPLPDTGSAKLVVLEHEQHALDAADAPATWAVDTMGRIEQDDDDNQDDDNVRQFRLMGTNAFNNVVSAKFAKAFVGSNQVNVADIGVSAFAQQQQQQPTRIIAAIDAQDIENLEDKVPRNTVLINVPAEPISPAFSGSLPADHPVARLYRKFFGKKAAALGAEADPNPVEGPLDQEKITRVPVDPRIVDFISSIDVRSINSTLRYLTGEDPASPLLTRNSISSGPSGIDGAANYIQSRLDGLGIFETRQIKYRADYGPNVVAVFPGAVEPRKAIVIGAHYDSRGTERASTTQRAPGANDDGSGTSSIIEIAKAIKRLADIKGTNKLFRYSVHLVLFSGEEQGLFGSKAYANLIKTRGDPLTDDIIAMLQSDMIAYQKPGEAAQCALPTRYNTAELTELVSSVVKTYESRLQVGKSSACCSDHQSFWEAGFPATQVFERNGAIADPQYHKSADLSERTGYSLTQLSYISRGIAAVLATLADVIVA